ncbi:F18 fimbrial protein FedE [Escherichia coli]|nr:F18 fimbrial protein FedE [Escherichia coli]
MRFTKAALAALMMVVAGSGQAASTATATLTINVTFTQASCDIQVPASYNLGTLTPGVRSHTPLDITWTCADGGTPVKTALTAAIVKGSASGDEAVILQTVDDADSGVTLSLREKASGALIKLTGPSAGNYFCSDANAVAGVMRTCSLTPETSVLQGGPYGLASATLLFEVGYP